MDYKNQYPQHKLSAVIYLVLLGATRVSSWKHVHFEDKPPSTIYAYIGRNVTMRWVFTVDKNHPYKDEGEPFEFLFGEWKYPGYISLKMIMVKGEITRKRDSYYDKKLKWNGNITSSFSNCTSQITLVNLTSEDFKTYGVNIFAHPYILPLQQSLEIVQRKPPKINHVPAVMNVTEGSKAIIKCKADGAPLPEVKIHQSTLILDRKIGEAELIIEEVKPKHHGEYNCTVHSQDEPWSYITRSIQLNVIRVSDIDVVVSVGNTSTASNASNWFRGTTTSMSETSENQGSLSRSQPINTGFLLAGYYIISIVINY